MLAVSLACTGAAGCGYSLAGRGSFLPSYINTIGVPTFTNRTTVFNAETVLTEKVRQEFIGRGKYKVLPQNSGVDAVLIGEISSISLTPSSFTTQQIASRYTLTMTASITLRDLHENKVLWQNPSLMFRQDYDAPTSESGAVDISTFLGQDANALDRVSSEFARTIVSAILEAF
ncbi:MAG: LPS assembly lipoprotein LptE [Betaproteobacteria bacterium]